MNIKNPETHRLSRELAAITGESVTTAVTVAVAERLDRVRSSEQGQTPSDRAARVLAAARRLREGLGDDRPTVEHGDLLYDEHGLPR